MPTEVHAENGVTELLEVLGQALAFEFLNTIFEVFALPV
jgi:hypothetical protein